MSKYVKELMIDQLKADLDGDRSRSALSWSIDRKSTRLNSSHTEIYTLSLHDALPILPTIDYHEQIRQRIDDRPAQGRPRRGPVEVCLELVDRSEEHTSELQSHRDLHSFPTRRSSDLTDHRLP